MRPKRKRGRKGVLRKMREVAGEEGERKTEDGGVGSS